MNHGRPAPLLLTGILGACVTTAFLPAAEPRQPEASWAQWRGPSGQGYSDDMRVPLTWGDDRNLLWKTRLPGRGNSSPIVWGDRIFLTSASPSGDERFVLCVRASDGKLLWQQLASKGVEPGRTHNWNGYASPSCTTDGDHVYAFFGTPGLFCYAFDGKLIWRHSFGTFTTQTGWGTGASPFLFKDLVIQNCDNDGPDGLPPGRKAEEAAPMALVALDKQTGKVRWQSERNQGKGWSTPVLVPMPDGGMDLVLNSPFGVWAYEPRTGKEVWHCERHKGEESAMFGEPMPAFNAEMLFAASGRPGPLQAIRLGGTGDVTKAHVAWEASRRGSRDVASPMLVGDQLYLADRYGGLSLYEAKTGKLLAKERLGAKPMEDGTTFVLDPGPKLQVVGRNHLTDDTEFRASPAVVDGRLFLRSQSYLYCIGERK
jgi:outer membrane protein assembly factor BamB